MIKAKILDKELQNILNNIDADKMSIFLMADGLFRGALFHGTNFVNQMRYQHNLGILETLILGQACLCSALMVHTMKGREHLTLRYETDGVCSGFSTTVDSTGFVRGYLFNNPIPIDKPLENWDLSPFLGKGILSVSRFPENRKEPQIGTVEIINKNIAQDLSYYFLQSEQVHTAFNSSIQFDKAGRVIGAGGLFLQVMPGADEELIERVENAFNACPSLGQWFSEGGNIEDIVYGLFREFSPNIVLNRDMIFDCPCTKEKYIEYIKRLGNVEIERLYDDGKDTIEVVCHNCSSVYHILKKELM
ncbi:MAG: Hsp33 family molecular chaperone HslO [Treponema sp.]|nr:Hsp33 family molecular chaperone HslO [Treponema sp.]